MAKEAVIGRMIVTPARRAETEAATSAGTM
jgi:hypothetical protein